MTKLETNALRIAELMGYINCVNDRGIILYDYKNSLFSDYDIKRIYTSYDYLMPIVFECNGKSPYGDIFNISIYYDSVVIYINSERDSSYYYETEPKFIEAIQLACIKYLELKNG